jgi:hypothetical protein
MIAESGLSVAEARQFLRSNAIACYGQQRFGIKE